MDVKYKNFLEYIEHNKDKNSPIGDYCSDTLRYLKIYPDSPAITESDFSSMMGWQACDEARIVFKKAWKQYQRNKIE